ncbi:alpha-amylase family glycosyl hydrolase [Ectobacillus antri]|uniref:alpha-amylase family glycosyl hydrolase n=1 Tax=Ectobacillus antri TaxID=2486280 RepID=UPI0036241CE1
MIWLNPIYESPDFDNGYDILNYEDIMKKAGTMENLLELITETHARSKQYCSIKQLR